MTFAPPCEWVYLNDRIVSAAEAAVSVHAHALSYGTGTFEGIRAWWNPNRERLYLLEAAAHYIRLKQSAAILGLPLPMSVPDLVQATVDLVQSGSTLPVRMHDVDTHLSIAVTPMPGEYSDPRGVRCVVSTWRRAPDVVVPNRAKVTGGYTGPALAKTDAVRQGYDDAIMLTVDGFVAEASTSNIMVRQGPTWFTPPITDDILPGITRRQIFDLIPVVERRIHRSELYTSSEVLLCGTATVVVPVTEVDGRPIGDGHPGKTTVSLNSTIRAIARHTDPRHPEWTTEV
jgi:branched-chain amino acid aminotransferase